MIGTRGLARTPTKKSESSLFNRRDVGISRSIIGNKYFHFFVLFDEEVPCDKEKALCLIENLEKRGLLCCYEDRDILPGYPENYALQEFLCCSLTALILISDRSQANRRYLEKVDDVFNWTSDECIKVIPVLLDPKANMRLIKYRSIHAFKAYDTHWLIKLVDRLYKAIEIETTRRISNRDKFMLPYNKSSMAEIRNRPLLKELLNDFGVWVADDTISLNIDKFLSHINEKVLTLTHAILQCKTQEISTFKLRFTPQSLKMFKQSAGINRKQLVEFFEDVLLFDFNGSYDRSTFRHRINGSIDENSRAFLISISSMIYLENFKKRSNDYRTLQSRISTYRDATDFVKARKQILAEAGFIYVGSNEFFVLCPWCNTARYQVSEKEFDQQELVNYHYKWGKHCQFLKDSSFFADRRPVYDDYENILGRYLGINTEEFNAMYDQVFEHNKTALCDLDCFISARQLTDMGFIFRCSVPKPFSICVVCYSCRIILSEFRDADELLMQHIKWSTQCQHLQASEEEYFVRRTFQQMVPVLEREIFCEFSIVNVLVERASHRSDNKSLLDANYEFSDKVSLCDVTHTVTWRNPPEFSELAFFKLMDELGSYTPYNCCVKSVNVLLLGHSSSGKSSFIDGISSIYKGRLCTQCCVGSQGKLKAKEVSTTMIKKNTETLNFNLCEWQADIKFLTCQKLQGILHGDYNIDMPKRSKEEAEDPCIKEWLSRRIHSVGVVVRADDVGSMCEEDHVAFRRLYEFLQSKDYRSLILLTHLDQLCDEGTDPVVEAFSNVTIKEVVDKISTICGIPRNTIMLVKNYENECDLRLNMNILLLQAMQRLIHSADDYLELCCDRTQMTGYGDTEV